MNVFEWELDNALILPHMCEIQPFGHDLMMRIENKMRH